MYIAKIINNAVENSKINIKEITGDYYDDEGFLCCGKCNTRKQTEIEIMGVIKRPMCLCKCEIDKIEKNIEKRKAHERAIKIKELRYNCFHQTQKGNNWVNMEDWTFSNDNQKNPKITKAMQKYVENFAEMKSKGTGLLLYGKNGRGKTYSACEVANALIDKCIPVFVTNFATLADRLRATNNIKRGIIDNLNCYSLIVIDDLGAERKSEYMQEIVFNIIDGRYRAGLPMIITTNLTIDEIKNPQNIESARIYDRILERCFPIEFKGESQRRRKIIDNYDAIKNMLEL